MHSHTHKPKHMHKFQFNETTRITADIREREEKKMYECLNKKENICAHARFMINLKAN